MNRSKTRTARLSLEALPDRIVPTVSIDNPGVNGLLKVTGTDGNDIIVIDKQPGAEDDLRIRVYNRDTGLRREAIQQGPAYDPGGDGQKLSSIEVKALKGHDIVINWTAVPATLLGGEGDDVLQGGFGQDRLDGDVGSDYYYYANAPYSVLGPAFLNGNDRVNDFENASWGEQLGVDTIVEAAGSDRDWLSLYGLGSASRGVQVDLALTTQQTVSQGRLSLILSNGEGLEWVDGSDGPDVLRGNGRPNELYAGAGDDRLEGRGGNDRLYGGSGGDRYVFSGMGLGSDVISEYTNLSASDFNDTLDFLGIGVPAGGSLALVMSYRQQQTVVAGNLDLTLSGELEPQIENVIGSSALDVIYGNELNNLIDGGSGNDFLFGYGGRDTLYGGFGNDYLYGGKGDDYLYGDYPGLVFTLTPFPGGGFLGYDTLDGEEGTDYHEKWSGNSVPSSIPGWFSNIPSIWVS